MQELTPTLSNNISYAPRHSTKAVGLGHSIDHVKKRANWSLNSNTFQEFYYKPPSQEASSTKRGIESGPALAVPARCVRVLDCINLIVLASTKILVEMPYPFGVTADTATKLAPHTGRCTLVVAPVVPIIPLERGCFC